MPAGAAGVAVAVFTLKDQIPAVKGAMAAQEEVVRAVVVLRHRDPKAKLPVLATMVRLPAVVAVVDQAIPEDNRLQEARRLQAAAQVETVVLEWP
jgi:hypothetical protein